jgi:hypothetical protein
MLTMDRALRKKRWAAFMSRLALSIESTQITFAVYGPVAAQTARAGAR